jgi:hypothetical protein
MNTTATNSSTHGRNGTLTNGAAFISNQRLFGAVNLDGTNQYVLGPAIGATDNATQLTIACWIHADTFATQKIMCAKLQDANNLISIQRTAGVAGTDDLEVAIHKGTGTTNGVVYTTDNVLSAGTWIHIAVVYDGSQSAAIDKIQIYINGLLADRSSSGTVPTSYLLGCAEFCMGGRTEVRGTLGGDGYRQSAGLTEASYKIGPAS